MPKLAALLVGVAILVIACTPGTATLSPTAAPSAADAEAIARSIASRSVDDILSGSEATPFLTNWLTIQGGTLPALQRTQFCQALDLPFADKIIGGIVSVGLSALSLSLHKKPIPEEAKPVIDFVATFATKTCPQWDPTRPSRPTPKPTLPWYPLGYAPLLADPGVAWRWAPKGELCAAGTTGSCWLVDVVARNGCPTSLFLAVAGHDLLGTVIDPGEANLGPIAANAPTRIQLTPEVSGVVSASVDYISCS